MSNCCDEGKGEAYCCCCYSYCVLPVCIYIIFIIITGSMYGANKHSLDYDMNVTLSFGDSVLIPYDQQHSYDSFTGQVIEISYVGISFSSDTVIYVYQHTCEGITQSTYMRTTTGSTPIICNSRCEIDSFVYFVNKEGSLLTYNVTDFIIHTGSSAAAQFVVFKSYYKFMSFISGENEIPDQEASISGNAIVTFNLSSMSAPSYVHVGLNIVGSTDNGTESNHNAIASLRLFSVAQQILYNISQFDLVCYFLPNTMSSSCSEDVFQGDANRQCFVVYMDTFDGGAVGNVTAQVTSTESAILIAIFVGGLLIPCGYCIFMCCSISVLVCITYITQQIVFKAEQSSLVDYNELSSSTHDDDDANLVQLSSLQQRRNIQDDNESVDSENSSCYASLTRTHDTSFEEATISGIPLFDDVVQTEEVSGSSDNTVKLLNSDTELFHSTFNQADGHSIAVVDAPIVTTCTDQEMSPSSIISSVPETKQVFDKKCTSSMDQNTNQQLPKRLNYTAPEETLIVTSLAASAEQNSSTFMSELQQDSESMAALEEKRQPSVNHFKDKNFETKNYKDHPSKEFEADYLNLQKEIIKENPQVSTGANIQYESIPLSEEGLFHHSHDYGITIIIPPGAVQGPATLQFGATLLLKDFKCDDPCLHPVSPFVWFHTDQVLCKPAELHIPHDVIVDTMDDVMGIYLLTRSDEERGSFKLNDKISMSVGSNIIKLTSTHFCSLCLMANPVPKKRYHLVCAKKEFDDGTVHCDICVLYTFKCLQAFKSSYQGYEIFRKVIPFAFEELKIFSEVHEDSGWQMTHRELELSSIKESDVDFYTVLNTTPGTVCEDDIEALKYYEEEGSYPPCFKLLFSPHPTIQPAKSCHTKISLISKQETVVSVPIELKGERISSQQVISDLTDSAYGSYRNVNNGLHHDDNTSSSIFRELEKNSAAINNKEKDEFLVNIMSFLESRLTTNNWMKFGHHLGLSMTVIHEIEENVGHDIKRCIRHVLLCWSESSQDVSIKLIKEALQASGYHLLSAIAANQFENATYCFMCETIHGLDNSHESILNHLLNCNENAVQEPPMTQLSNFLVANISAKWELFGVQLCVPKNDIDVIRKNNPGDCKLCFIHLLYEWQRNSQSPYTWATVINVLYSSTLQEYSLAEKIYDSINKKMI